MGDLVNAWLPRLSGMALANRDKEKRWLRGLCVDDEDSSPAAVWLRKIVLNTTAKSSSVAGFSLTWTK